MKSRKKLKKEIRKSFNVLYRDLVFYKAFVENADLDAAKAILNKIPSIEDDFIKRISVNEGKHVKGRVKMYFNKLREDIDTKIDELTKEIIALP